MELFTIITALCICLSFMLSPCASHQLMVQSSTEEVFAVHHGGPLTPPALPRKLKIDEETMVKGSEKKEVPTFNKQNDDSSGKSYKKEANLFHGKKETPEDQWVEASDTSEIFTMDYRHVKRRRPIHNKSIPIAP